MMLPKNQRNTKKARRNPFEKEETENSGGFCKAQANRNMSTQQHLKRNDKHNDKSSHLGEWFASFQSQNIPFQEKQISSSPKTVVMGKRSCSLSLPSVLKIHEHSEPVAASFSAFAVTSTGALQQLDGNKHDENLGLWIRLHPETNILTFTPEAAAPFPHIHPHCFAPVSLQNVRALRGGGSGTAVFGAYHDTAGDVVCKHGGPRDTKEVLSLAEIGAELKARPDLQAASAMQARLPALVGVYCAPHHFRDRGQEDWKNAIRRPVALSDLVQQCLRNNGSDDDDDDQDSSSEEEEAPAREGLLSSFSNHSSRHQMTPRTGFQDAGTRRKICVHGGTHVDLEVFLRSVLLHVPNLESHPQQEGAFFLRQGVHDCVRQLATVMAEEQAINSWKVTLMQKTIGGPGAMNGALALTSGILNGPLLDKVIEEFAMIIRHLQTLTWSHEKAGLKAARDEYHCIRSSSKSCNVASVSKATDDFCGSALRKNFTAETGRFARLREFGRLFCNHSLMLEPAERFPASFLGACLRRGVDLADIFLLAQASASALDRLEDKWVDVLELATRQETYATDRIWTCGLTDAGLHNTFLCQERGLELFDLGKPQLMPVPAFLTKFLMSFFHALGMEETQAGDGSTFTWVRRFGMVGGKLCLTKETQSLLPGVYEAFDKTMNHFVRDLFNGDERVRLLLLKYVVLQLLSDGAFCLLRWEEKGGGKKRFGKNATGDLLHKWLWRCLWDIYIASDLHEKLVVSKKSNLLTNQL